MSVLIGDFSVVFSSFAIGILANIFERITRLPMVLFSVNGILLIVPGSLAVRGFLNLHTGNFDDSLEAAVRVLLIVLQISLGILIAEVLFRPVFKKTEVDVGL
ncbi:hypothetical protein GEMRC1_008120 [Eukaryota sp. GEM-RC1]